MGQALFLSLGWPPDPTLSRTGICLWADGCYRSPPPAAPMQNAVSGVVVVMRAEQHVASRTGHGLMHPVVVLLACSMMAAVLPSRTAHAATVDALGDRAEIVIRGLETLAPEQLLEPLARDADVIWLSRPHADRDAFITTVVAKCTAALEHAGFAKPRVAATVEPVLGTERLVLEVAEGPRYLAGSVAVEGLPADLAARLVEWLVNPRPPVGARAAPERSTDGPTVRWLSADGFPVEPEPPVWPQTGPAACDAFKLHDAQTAVARFLREEGYLGIAPVSARRGHVRPTAEGRRSRPAAADADAPFEVSLRPDGNVMDLVVTVRRLPPLARLRGIDIPAACRTTEAAVARYLEIEQGGAVTERNRIAWREKLRESARFLRHEIELRVDSENPSAVVAAFDLEEYPAVPPLGEPLSREEAAVLRCRDWLLDAMARGEDLVIDIARQQTGADATARLVVSPDGGLLLTALPGTSLACGAAVGNAVASLMPPGGNGRIDLPLPADCCMSATLAFELGRDKSAPAKQTSFRHTLSCGCGLATRAGLRPGIALESRIEPVACVALVHERNPHVRFEDDVLVIESGAMSCRIDQRTGRLVGLRGEGFQLSADARPGAYASETTSLRDAAGPDRLQADAPVTSALSLLLSEDVAAACGRLVAAAGFGPESGWDASLATVERVARALKRCLDDGAAARCDGFLVEAAAQQPVATPPAPLEIPREDEPQSTAAARKALVRHVAAFVWRLSEQHCGRDSWPAAVVRAGALGLVGDMAVLDEVTQFMLHEEYGPLAHAAASLLSPVQPVSVALARRGRERLSTVAFRTDCHPLLAAVEPYGLDQVIVAVARAVDDETIREFGKVVCDDPEVLLPLARSLRTHSSHDDAVAGLQSALDACWEQGLKLLVSAQLDVVAAPRTAVAPGATDERPVKK
jgi:hypothetical protein